MSRRGRRLPSLLHPLGTCGAGVRVPVAVVAEAKDKEEEDTGKKSKPIYEPPPDPIAGQLMCPSHEKLCKKGICSGMSRLVMEEERKKKGVEMEVVVVGKPGFVRLFAFSVFNFSLVFAPCGFCFWFRFCFRFFHYSCLGSHVFCSSWFR